MQLILWRHAEAEDGDNDLQRALTAKGRQQAKASAAWLKNHLPPYYALWASEAVRSQQTAACLSPPSQIVPLLNPLTQAAQLPPLLQRHYLLHADATVVWVGHQPWIGQLCAWLLNGQWPADGSGYWSVKKSAFWWFELAFDAQGHPAAKLKTALCPSLLRKSS